MTGRQLNLMGGCHLLQRQPVNGKFSPRRLLLATRPRDYKTFFMLNSNEHEISIARGKITIYSLKLSNVVSIPLITDEMPTIDF